MSDTFICSFEAIQTTIMYLQEKILLTHKLALNHLIQAENYEACASMHNAIQKLENEIEKANQPVIIDLTRLL